MQQSSVGDIDTFTHRPWYAHMFFTLTLLHTDAFTHKRFYTQTLLYTNMFRQRRCRHFESKKPIIFKAQKLYIRWCFRVFWKVWEQSLGAKNTVTTTIFDASQAQNHIIYGVFVPGAKNRGIYSVWLAPCRNSGIYAILTCCKKYFFHAKNKKCKLQCFGFWHPMKNVRKTWENNKKCPKWGFSFNLQKRGKWRLVFLSSPHAGSGLTFPKRAQIRASSPPRPPD